MTCFLIFIVLAECTFCCRLGRSHIGYGGRSSFSGEESPGLYGSHHGMGYGGMAKLFTISAMPPKRSYMV